MLACCALAVVSRSTGRLALPGLVLAAAGSVGVSAARRRARRPRGESPRSCQSGRRSSDQRL